MRESSVPRDLAKRLLLAFMVPFLLFAGTEGLLRLTGFSFNPMTHSGNFGEHFEAKDEEHYVRDPLRFWIPKPGLMKGVDWLGENGAMISSLSTRGQEPVRPKPSQEVRILCVGDSGTFGWGVNDENAYPAALERLLDSWSDQALGGKLDFDVVNAGVNGYSTFQTIQMYRILDKVLTPDLLVFSSGRNDCVALQMSDPDRPIIAPWAIRIFGVLGRFRTGQALFWMGQRRTIQILQEAQSRDQLVLRVSADQFNVMMHSVCEENKALGRPILFIPRGGHQRVLRTLRDAGDLILVDLDLLSDLGQIGLFLEGGHPDSEAHQLIAEEIFLTLQREGILEAWRR